jgi:thiol-disulfide isomerase/thioredoxin
VTKPSNPTRLTAVLSAAALLGYLSYRLVEPVFSPDDAGTVSRPLADRLPEFALADLEGRMTPIGSWPGRPMVINFWATWCAPCLREIPLLKAYQAEQPDVTVVGIALDQVEPVRTFAAEMQFNYPVLIGQADAMDAAAAFGVGVFALPFTVFTAPDGATLGVRTGEIHAEHLENLTAALADLEAGRIDLNAARARIAGRR